MSHLFRLNFDRLCLIDIGRRKRHKVCFGDLLNRSTPCNIRALSLSFKLPCSVAADDKPSDKRINTLMDLSQALLCLVTFNSSSPVATPPGIGAVGSAACQQSIDKQAKKVDLDFHAKALRSSGGHGVMDAATGAWQVAPPNEL